MQRVVVLAGFGIMGQGIVKNILYYCNNFKIYLYQPRIQILESNNLKMVQTLDDVQEKIYAIISCLPDDEATSRFWSSVDVVKKIRKNHCYCIEMSTGSYEQMMKNSEFVEYNEGKYVECPVTGSRKGAESRNLTLFVHDRYACELSGFFNLFSKKTIKFSEFGNATKFKLLYNCWGFTILYTLKLFYPYLITIFGKDRETVYEALSNYGWMSSICKDKLLDLDNNTLVSFKYSHMMKDINYGNKLLDLDDPVWKEMTAFYQQLLDNVDTSEDYVKVVLKNRGEENATVTPEY